MKRVRSFDWRDAPALYRCRQHSAYLDSSLVLTRGTLFMHGALLSYLAPSMGIFTSVTEHNGRSSGEGPRSPLFGQMIHLPGTQRARLVFLTPISELEPEKAQGLLEHFMTTAGDRGAYHLLAEADEHTAAFEVLRNSSFAIYTRQRIWQIRSLPEREPAESNWRPASDRDLILVKSLYTNLVPGLVQQVEPFTTQSPRGMVYCQSGEVLAYVDLKYGHRGIWVQPFVHPDAEDAGEWFADLVQNLPYRRSRPVYICIRSYQSWLEPGIEALGAEHGPRQAVMVKHLAVPQKATRMFALPAIERGYPEISAPIAHVDQYRDLNRG